MHQKIQEFINAREEETRRKNREGRGRILIENGLYEREYTDFGYSSEYCIFDYELNKYYKKIPIECSDEDFEELKKHLPTPYVNNSGNMLYKVLLGIVIAIWVVGFIIGISTYNEFIGMITVFVAWIASFIIGLSIYVFAEIIRLLDIIARK